MSAIVVSNYVSSETSSEFGSGSQVFATVVSGVANDAESVRPLSGSSVLARRKQGSTPRGFVVKRRLKGILMEAHGDTWRVVFVENGEKIPYDLPAERLRKAGIETRYQPFEMDEMEPIQNELAGKIYRFRPLAEAKDAFLEILPLDPERQRKRDLILARFGKSQS